MRSGSVCCYIRASSSSRVDFVQQDQFLRLSLHYAEREAGEEMEKALFGMQNDDDGDPQPITSFSTARVHTAFDD